MSDKMIYKKFYFKNYKGINSEKNEEVEIDANSNKPYCIIGNNEGGKTTILKGMEFISCLCRGEGIQLNELDKIHKKDLYYTGNVIVGAVLEFNKNDIETFISNEYTATLPEVNELDIKYEFNFSDVSFVKECIITIKLNRNQIIEEKIITDNKIVEHNKSKAVFDIIKNNSQDVLYYDDFMFSVPKVVRFTHHNQQINDPENIFNSQTNKKWQKIFSDILTGSSHKKTDKTYEIKDFQRDVIDWDGSEDNKDGRVEKMGDYLTKLLKNWIQEQDINTDIKNIKITKHNNANGFIDYKIKIYSNSTEPYEVSERSKGLQWTFCFNILTSIRKERHNNGFIFLLDEPASNLHILLQSKMLDEMNKLCNNKNLVIYTTHAPDLIDLENIDNWRFVKNRAGGEFEETNIIFSKDTADDIIVMPIISKIAFDIIKDIKKEKQEVHKKAIDKIKDVCKNGYENIKASLIWLKNGYDKLPEPVKQVATDCAKNYVKKQIGIN